MILKIAVAHSSERPLELFAREIFPSATSMAQGITGFAGGRPAVQPIVRLASCLIPKDRVPATIEMKDAQGARGHTAHGRTAGSSRLWPRPRLPTRRDRSGRPPNRTAVVPLVRLAHGRSGDKGDTANIGVLARRPEFLPLLAEQLTAAAVRDYLSHLVEGEVVRYDWPGLNGWNFVLHRALGGGGVASLRYDPQGKSYAQILMDLPVRVPQDWLRRLPGASCEGGPRPGRRRERLPRDERVADIMRAARQVFCRKGYAETSTAEIAAAAGVVEGTLYRYFPSKRDLLIRVVEDFYEAIFSDYEAQLHGRARHLEPAAVHDLEAPERDARGSGNVPPDRA